MIYIKSLNFKESLNILYFNCVNERNLLFKNIIFEKTGTFEVSIKNI